LYISPGRIEEITRILQKARLAWRHASGMVVTVCGRTVNRAFSNRFSLLIIHPSTTTSTRLAGHETTLILWGTPDRLGIPFAKTTTYAWNDLAQKWGSSGEAVGNVNEQLGKVGSFRQEIM
jgi:hypothetical protein